MQRLTLIALAALAVSTAACKKKQPVEYVQEGTSQLTSVVNVADPRAGVQMLRGFHELESNSWRWTASSSWTKRSETASTKSSSCMAVSYSSGPQLAACRLADGGDDRLGDAVEILVGQRLLARLQRHLDGERLLTLGREAATLEDVKCRDT